MKKGIIISLFWGMGMATGMAQSVYPGICERQFRVSVQVPLAAESFDLQDVRLLPGRFRDNMMRDSAWMVSIGADRLLHGFRPADPFCVNGGARALAVITRPSWPGTASERMAPPRTWYWGKLK